MENIEYPKKFKKLVQDITYSATQGELDRVLWQISRSYEAGVISWREQEMLLDLASKIRI